MGIETGISLEHPEPNAKFSLDLTAPQLAALSVLVSTSQVLLASEDKGCIDLVKSFDKSLGRYKVIADDLARLKSMTQEDFIIVTEKVANGLSNMVDECLHHIKEQADAWKQSLNLSNSSSSSGASRPPSLSETSSALFESLSEVKSLEKNATSKNGLPER